MSDLFVRTDDAFAAVGDLRRGVTDFVSADGLQGVSLSHAGGADALATIAALAAALPESFAPQLQLLADTVSIGVLDVLTADYIPYAGEGELAGDG